MPVRRDHKARLTNLLLSCAAGMAAFTFTLVGFLVLRDTNEQLAASLTMGFFALSLVWIAYEKPNSSQSRAIHALIDRLLAVEHGDLSSPAPPIVQRQMPALANAVDSLFARVQINLDNVHALALYDPVTALPNRIHFLREAERALAMRRNGRYIALLFVDLNGFKEINDTHGHSHGDAVLATVGDRLRKVVQAETRAGFQAPLVARLAGDEFVLLLPSMRDAGDALAIAGRALAALQVPFPEPGPLGGMGASIGVAMSPTDSRELPALMRAADIAMYHAKASGHSKVCLYNQRMANAFDRKGGTRFG